MITDRTSRVQGENGGGVKRNSSVGFKVNLVMTIKCTLKQICGERWATGVWLNLSIWLKKQKCQNTWQA